MTLSSNDNQPGASQNLWASLLSSSLQTLRQLAGTTEREFLQIGTQMQGIYQKALKLSDTAHRLVEVASGEYLHGIMTRLRQVLQDMEKYLEQARFQNSANCGTLAAVQALLQKVVPPLEGVKKMSKHLYIFEVSIKVESAYLGDTGSEFINLAMDIKKLSQQVKEKVKFIDDHRLKLIGMITKNSLNINAVKSTQEAKVGLTLDGTAASLSELESINERFSRLGGEVSAVSTENSRSISEIVQSMQFHDIYRQQVEHVVEALEGVVPACQADCHGEGAGGDLIGQIGDVCELQEAQLQFASSELYSAVSSIVMHLRDIGLQQKKIARDICEQTSADASESSFIEDLSGRMSSVADLLIACAESNTVMAGLMQEVTGTVAEITNFVSDIEEIGNEIVQIAQNARIKASCTGKQGASLSVLAEEIGQLSNNAVQRTDLITRILTEVDTATRGTSGGGEGGDAACGEKLAVMKAELDQILSTLESMGKDLMSLLSQIRSQVDGLNSEIDRITDGICVHEMIKAKADAVVDDLKTIVMEARSIKPASSKFRDDLRQMAERYTMESERRIHADIARKHGIHAAAPLAHAVADSCGNASEFGDNVDLF
ncbi:MAG: hypothetical protein P4L42_06260 [Desulfocapsaceae bacterium]|nr:hypothetical protein [Desulfocapsaceae bacterium]